MSKTSKILALIYIFFCISALFYIRSVMKSENVRQKKDKDTDIEEVYQIKTTLNLYNGNSVTQMSETMKNTEDIIRFLEELRQHGKIVFEKVDYTYGTEIESVNGVVAPQGYKWAIIEGDKDITLEIANTDVPKDGNLDLKLIQDQK